jgi:predicted nucleic acid-binding protein
MPELDARVGRLARVYVDTSVVVALSSPQDEFHDDSVRFVGALRDRAIPSSIGPPFILEMAKAVEQRGRQAALRLTLALEEYEVELTKALGERLWSLSEEYLSRGVLGENRILDLLHYASATLLGCTHLASWDKSHFIEGVEKRVNKANTSRGLTALKVGDPVAVGRYLGFA